MEGIRFYFPEPPSHNRQLDLAGMVKRKRAYHGAKAKWSRVARFLLPVVPDDAPWEQWRIHSIHYRLWQLRDPLELLSGAKWAVDLMVEEGYVLDDGPSSLLDIAYPTQVIDRGRRGLEVVIVKVGC